jgi:hypothetical protein
LLYFAFQAESNGPEVVHCKRGEPETVATVVVDVDFGQLSAEGRLSLLDNFLGHMGLQQDMVKVVPAHSKLLQVRILSHHFYIYCIL